MQCVSMQQIRYALIRMVRTKGIPVATACRVLKISRKTGHKWLRRYDSDPIYGLEDLCRRPHYSPKALPEVLKQQIIDLHRTTGLGPRGVRRQMQNMSSTTPSLSSIFKMLQSVRTKEEVVGSSDLPSALEALCLGLLAIFPSHDVSKSILNAPTTKQLLTIIRTGTIRERKRAGVIALLALGETLTRAAKATGSSRASAKKYWDVYAAHGVNSILNPSRKQKRSDRPEIQSIVFRVLHTPPDEHGFNRTTWRMKDLNLVLRRQGTAVSGKVISEIIHLAGYQWKKARKVLTSNDPEYRQKLNHIKGILSGLQPDERFFSIDEFGPVVIKLQPGRRLVAPGECPTVPQVQKSKGRLLLIGALELGTNQLTHFFAERKSTDEMVRLMDGLIEQYRNCRKLYLSWDGASWHTSRPLIAKIWEVNTDDYRRSHQTPEVQLVPLPAGAQFLNVIESVFSGMARAIIHNSDYDSVEQARAAVDRYIGERNEHFIRNPKRAGNKIWGKERVVSAFSDDQNCKDPRW